MLCEECQSEIVDRVCWVGQGAALCLVCYTAREDDAMREELAQRHQGRLGAAVPAWRTPPSPNRGGRVARRRRSTAPPYPGLPHENAYPYSCSIRVGARQVR